MTYPYGTRGAPAVGGGLPGLPRREGADKKPSPLESTWDKYKVVGAYTSNTETEVRLLSSDGVEEQYLTLPPSGNNFFPSVDENNSLLFIPVANSSSTPTTLSSYLISLPDFEVISTVQMDSVPYTSGSAINSELGLIAVPYGTNQVAFYRIEDYILADGGHISSVTPYDTLTLSEASARAGRMDWSPQGDLFLVTSNAGANYVDLYEYPSKTLVQNLGRNARIALANRGQRCQGFSGDGNFLVTGTNSPSADSAVLCKIDRGPLLITELNRWALSLNAGNVAVGEEGDGNAVVIYPAVFGSNPAVARAFKFKPGEGILGANQIGSTNIQGRGSLSISRDGRVGLFGSVRPGFLELQMFNLLGNEEFTESYSSKSIQTGLPTTQFWSFVIEVSE